MTAGSSHRDDRLLTEAYDNAVGLFRALARASRTGRCDEGDGVVLVHTGSPVAFFNPAFVTRPPADVSAMFRRIDAFYSGHGTPSVVYARVADATAIDSHAPAAGFTRAPDERGLTLTLGPHAIAKPPSDLEIVVVRDTDSLDIFHDVSARAFDEPRGWLGDLDVERLAAIPGLTLYLGLLNHEPVSTGALFVSGPIAGVHLIGTVTEHRRQGLGQAITRRVIHDGASAGCTTCALTSSDLSHRMYLRMGFQHVTNYAVWEKS